MAWNALSYICGILSYTPQVENLTALALACFEMMRQYA